MLGDTACRPLPVTPLDIRAMLDEVRTLGPLLRGHRGAPPGDVSALVAAIMGVARLAESLGDRLLALDVNPIVVEPRGRGAWAVDLLVDIEAPASASVRRRGTTKRSRRGRRQ